MATLNQVIRERKKKFVLLRRMMRSIDTQVEKSQRLITRVLSRKSKVPEASDLLELVKLARELDTLLDSYIGEAGSSFPV